MLKNMKKALLATIVLFCGMTLNAQVSVWDGSSAIWTNGNGTEADPYLIESAENLAFLASKIESYHNWAAQKQIFQDTVFKMTVDVDLSGTEGLAWLPIGLGDNFNSYHVAFAGVFDGDGHTVSNMHVMDTLDNYCYQSIGLFGYAINATIKNVKVIGNSIVMYNWHNGGSATCVGGIIGYGRNVNISNCYSEANIVCDANIIESVGCYVGGIAGNVTDSHIVCCHNNGSVNSSYATVYGEGFAGGIAGCAYNCILSECCNTGIINANITNTQSVFSGGIVGMADGSMLIEHCYNNADICAYANGIAPTYSAGIIGYVAETSTIYISSCYHVGALNASNTGGIIITVGYDNQVDNCYFVDDCGGDNGYGTPKPSSEMKTQYFVDMLNCATIAFAMDYSMVNDGYPVLLANFVFIVENYSPVRNIFPNPTRDNVYIELSSDAQCQSIDIFSLDGLLLEKFPETSLQTTKIDISNLNPGVYVMKIRMNDGKEFSEKLIKE